MTSKLPALPSALIRVALEDLKKVEASDKYIVNMHNWHQPRRGKCMVCLAGSVMAMTLGADRLEDVVPFEFIHEQAKLHALNHFRRGNVRSGVFALDFPCEHLSNRVITSYEENRNRFFSDMEQLASDLEKVSL